MNHQFSLRWSDHI